MAKKPRRWAKPATRRFNWIKTKNGSEVKLRCRQIQGFDEGVSRWRIAYARFAEALTSNCIEPQGLHREGSMLRCCQRWMRFQDVTC